jgi:hypothetical protein
MRLHVVEQLQGRWRAVVSIENLVDDTESPCSQAAPHFESRSARERVFGGTQRPSLSSFFEILKDSSQIDLDVKGNPVFT